MTDKPNGNSLAAEQGNEQPRSKQNDLPVNESIIEPTVLISNPRLRKTYKQGAVAEKRHKIEESPSIYLPVSQRKIDFAPQTKRDIAEVTQIGLQQVTVINSGRENSSTSFVDHQAVDKPENFSKTPSPVVEVGSLIKGRFKLLELIGAGGMGDVYKAKDLRQAEAGDDHPYVALKVLSPFVRDNPTFFIALQQETKKARLLSHPNIINVYDFDRDGDLVYMTMELLQGRTLDEVIDARMMPNLELDPMRIIKGMAEGLLYAHANGIAHADLKPSNIFIEDNGNVKIVDFGIARAMEQDNGLAIRNNGFDVAKLEAVTPAFTSLRRLRGNSAQIEDDYYSFGCVAYMLLSGKHPYRSKTAEEVQQCGQNPAKIEILNRKQWLALSRLIDVNADPSGALENLIACFFPSRVNKRWIILLLLLICLSTVGLLSLMGKNWLENRAIIQSVQSHLTLRDITPSQLLQRLNAFSQEERLLVINQLREPILVYFQTQFEMMSDWQNDGYDLVAVGDLLSQLNKLFPDSARLTKMRADWLLHRDQALNELKQRFEDLWTRQIYWNPDSDLNLAKIIALISRTNPRERFIEHERVIEGYSRYIKEQLFYGDTIRAKEVVLLALSVYPDDQGLQELLKTVNHTQASSQANRQENGETSDALFRSQQQYLKRLDQTQESINLARQNQLERSNDSTGKIMGFLQEIKTIDIEEYQIAKESMLRAMNIKEDEITSELVEGKGEKATRTKLQSPAAKVDPTPVAVKSTQKKTVCPLYFAGKGFEQHYQCRDKIGVGRVAPNLVVIPASRSQGAFAIMQQEVSAQEYAYYCSQSKSCPQLVSVNKLPMTGLTIEEIKRYARWLSRETGQRYRLPTDAEWNRASATSLRSSVKDFNCRVIQNNKIIRGRSLRDTDMGYLDQYGLRNMVGNAAEITVEGKGFWVRGGHFQTAFDVCQKPIRSALKLQRESNVGFRLVREL